MPTGNMLKKSQVLKEGRRRGLLQAIRAVEEILVKESRVLHDDDKCGKSPLMCAAEGGGNLELCE